MNIDSLWNILSFFIIAYEVILTSSTILNSLFINGRMYSFEKNKEVNVNYCIDFVIPLLNEENRFDDLASLFSKILISSKSSRLILITSEREFLKSPRGNSTLDLIEQFQIRMEVELKDRIVHLHYPEINNVVAKQLNCVLDLHSKNIKYQYYIFYNADSRVTIDIENIIKPILDGRIFQQSSLFTSNISELLRKKRYLTISLAIYQSIWTIRTEMSILRMNSAIFLGRKKLPILTHSITHGLIIPKEILEELKGFPDLKQGGEDVALGYLCCMLAQKTTPIGNLENSESPTNFVNYFNQMKFWFTALFFCFDYSYKGLTELYQIKRTRYLILKLQAILSLLRKPFVGIFIIFYLYLGCFNEVLVLSIMIYVSLILTPYIVFILLYSSLDKHLFPPIEFRYILIIGFILPMAPIVRSVASFFGLVEIVKMKRSNVYLKPKTE